MSEITYENKVLCAACGGKCCRIAVGVCSPDDFPGGEGQITEAVKSAKFIIDNFEGLLTDDTNEITVTYLVRPARNEKGGCVLWTETGCELEYAQRPYTCRMFEPSDAVAVVLTKSVVKCACANHGKDFRALALDWLKYADLLKKLLEG